MLTARSTEALYAQHLAHAAGPRRARPAVRRGRPRRRRAAAPIADGFLATATAQERADILEALYLPISARGGDLLYTLARASRPQTIVELGTSFGISTVYLAAAVGDNSMGRVFAPR